MTVGTNECSPTVQEKVVLERPWMTEASLMGAANVIKLYCVYEALAVIQFEEKRRAAITLGKFTLGNLDLYQANRTGGAQRQIRTITG